MAEALSYGLPSVGFSESLGVNELIIDNHNGLLASGNNNEQSLLNALSTLMSNSILRNEMSINAINSMKKFKPKKIYDQWEELFNKSTH